MQRCCGGLGVRTLPRLTRWQLYYKLVLDIDIDMVNRLILLLASSVVLVVGCLAGRCATTEMQGVDDGSVDMIGAHSDGAADVG